MKRVVQSLCGKLIVSCQAFEPSPLCDTHCMALMAQAAEQGGAGGIRACWAENIRAVKTACALPVIGVNKVIEPGKPMMPDRVYITPSFDAAAEIIQAGCDILGMDFTPRNRSYGTIGRMVEAIKNAYPGTPILADISTLEEGVMAERLGADIVSTTLSGYTLASIRAKHGDYVKLLAEYRATGEVPETDPDYTLIAALKKSVRIPVNAEGRFWERDQAARAFAEGADMLTIGSAITAPNAITRRFVRALSDRTQGE